jgi:hypothetical protein
VEEDNAITEEPPVPPQKQVVNRVSQMGQSGISMTKTHEKFYYIPHAFAGVKWWGQLTGGRNSNIYQFTDDMTGKRQRMVPYTKSK